MDQVESKGILLFRKDHKEKDMLVKIFTESSGKLMFYVKGAHRKNNPLAIALMPYTQATYIGKFNSKGLSFLNSAKKIKPYSHIQKDIFAAGYATYLMNLADAAIEDQLYDPALYTFLAQALTALDQKLDGAVVSNIFEVQILQRFGVAINWQECAICGQNKGKFDYSSKYSGVLCEKHWHLDEHRYHADVGALHFIRLFDRIGYREIHSIQLKKATKKNIRLLLDQIYDEYVGLHLKSKKFIDQMDSWADMLKPH